MKLGPVYSLLRRFGSSYSCTRPPAPQPTFRRRCCLTPPQPFVDFGGDGYGQKWKRAKYGEGGRLTSCKIAGCTTRPSFGEPGAMKPSHCGTHKVGVDGTCCALGRWVTALSWCFGFSFLDSLVLFYFAFAFFRVFFFVVVES